MKTNIFFLILSLMLLIFGACNQQSKTNKMLIQQIQQDENFAFTKAKVLGKYGLYPSHLVDENKR